MGLGQHRGGRARRRVAAGGLLVVAVGLAGCDLGARPTTYPVEGTVVAAVDVDGDSKVDLVAASARHVSILSGDGSGAFAAAVAQERAAACESASEYVTCSPSTPTFLDVDADGDVDMLEVWTVDSSLPPPATSTVWTLVGGRLNDGTGAFGGPEWTSSDAVESTVAPPAATFGDVTGDGLPDLLFTDDDFASDRRIRVRPGDGTGGFGPAVVSPAPAQNLGGPRVVDLDDDGDGDLLFGGTCVTGASGEDWIVGCFDVALGDGSGAFGSWSRHTAADPEVDGLAPVTTDMDLDGDLDVVAGTMGTDFDGGGAVGALATFAGDGAGGFGPEVSAPAPEQTVSARAADFDADGVPDLLASVETTDTSGTTYQGRILFGDGAGGFGDAHAVATGREVIADLDADGWPDLVRNLGDAAAVYLNRWDEHS